MSKATDPTPGASVLKRNGRLTKICRTLEVANPWKVALAVYVASLVCLLVFGFSMHFRYDVVALEADEAEYFGLASQIMSGVWDLSPRRTMGFPILIAGIRSATGSLLALQICMSVIFAFSAPALFAVVRRITASSAAGFFAGLLFALWPPAIFYGSSIYSETAALPVFLASLALIPAGSRIFPISPAKYGAALLSGLTLGLAAQIRPMYLLFLPVLAIILLVEEKSIRLAIGRYSAALLGFTILVAPWSVYMSIKYHRPVILTANGGETLAGGLTPKLLEIKDGKIISSGNRDTWVGPGKWLPIYENGYLTSSEIARPYTELDPILQSRAVDWALDHPAAASYIELRKILYMWGIYPWADNGMMLMAFGNLPTVLILLASLLLFVRLPSVRAKFIRLWLLTAFVSGVALISWGSWRFRQPADAGLLAFTVCCLWTMSRLRSHTDGKSVQFPNQFLRRA